MFEVLSPALPAYAFVSGCGQLLHNSPVHVTHTMVGDVSCGCILQSNACTMRVWLLASSGNANLGDLQEVCCAQQKCVCAECVHACIHVASDLALQTPFKALETCHQCAVYCTMFSSTDEIPVCVCACVWRCSATATCSLLCCRRN
jgi:hypothetical protein